MWTTCLDTWVVDILFPVHKIPTHTQKCIWFRPQKWKCSFFLLLKLHFRSLFALLRWDLLHNVGQAQKIYMKKVCLVYLAWHTNSLRSGNISFKIRDSRAPKPFSHTWRMDNYCLSAIRQWDVVTECLVNTFWLKCHVDLKAYLCVIHCIFPAVTGKHLELSFNWANSKCASANETGSPARSITDIISHRIYLYGQENTLWMLLLIRFLFWGDNRIKHTHEKLSEVL